MKQIEALRQEANLRASAFNVQIEEARNQLNPLKILDEAVGSLDPGYAILKQVQRRVRENPFALLAVVSATMLLLRQFTTDVRPHLPINHTAAKRSRLARSTAKGDDHGQYIDTK